MVFQQTIFDLLIADTTCDDMRRMTLVNQQITRIVGGLRQEWMEREFFSRSGARRLKKS
jgi:hypothetical protein